MWLFYHGLELWSLTHQVAWQTARLLGYKAKVWTAAAATHAVTT